MICGHDVYRRERIAFMHSFLFLQSNPKLSSFNVVEQEKIYYSVEWSFRWSVAARTWGIPLQYITHKINITFDLLWMHQGMIFQNKYNINLFCYYNCILNYTLLNKHNIFFHCSAKIFRLILISIETNFELLIQQEF